MRAAIVTQWSLRWTDGPTHAARRVASPGHGRLTRAAGRRPAREPRSRATFARRAGESVGDEALVHDSTAPAAAGPVAR
ncbi:hypothetical protein ACH4U6_01050 [Streptomyces netropsis]|uniref:hypothetical protein n=1 Tax=Streptomyces netropsis TaxID=55404 RepID=UPI0037B9BF8C